MVKVNSKSQKGRSMVEMLGVLAIIGVLSVGGVYGYGVAMKKHKANELLHQASMLATTISAQAMSNDGTLPSTITNFGNSSYGSFSQSVTEALDGKGFSLKIEDVGFDVCNQLKKGGIVQKVDCDEASGNATITYYKNLATDPAEGKNSPTGGSAGTADPLCQDVKCESGQQCIGGACAEVTGECSKNADCDKWCETKGDGEKCYCQISANYTENDSACYDNFTGQCAVATPRSGIKGGYVASREDMNWWSAVNFCKAHNASLLSLADLGITGGYQDETYCDGDGSDCTGTFTWSDLQDKLGKYAYWVTDAVNYDSDTGLYTLGTNNNSCSAFHVDLSYSRVSHYVRDNYQDYSALCE